VERNFSCNEIAVSAEDSLPGGIDCLEFTSPAGANVAIAGGVLSNIRAGVDCSTRSLLVAAGFSQLHKIKDTVPARTKRKIIMSDDLFIASIL